MDGSGGRLLARSGRAAREALRTAPLVGAPEPGPYARNPCPEPVSFSVRRWQPSPSSQRTREAVCDGEPTSLGSVACQLRMDRLPRQVGYGHTVTRLFQAETERDGPGAHSRSTKP